MGNKIKEVISSLYVKENVNISTYVDGNYLLEEISNGKSYNIIFLDIEMPILNGFKVAEIIRKYNKEMVIIFLTSMDDKVFESLKYNPLRFLRKQKVDEELKEALNAAISVIEEVEIKYVFNTDCGSIKVGINDIMYIECINRKVYLKTLNERFNILKTQFNKLVEEYTDRDFVLIHRSCMVNLKYISSINKLDITLDNNEKLPVSRYKVNDLKRAFTLYAE